MKGGFSLTELLVILVLLTLFLALVMPLSMRWYRSQMIQMEADKLALTYKIAIKKATSKTRFYRIKVNQVTATDPDTLEFTYEYLDYDTNNWQVDSETRLQAQLDFVSSNQTAIDWKLLYFTPMGEIKYCPATANCDLLQNLYTSLQYVPYDMTITFARSDSTKRVDLLIRGGGMVDVRIYEP